MQKLFFASMLLLLQKTTAAQEPADMLRMAWTDPTGTARHQAIGGAMVALGGDLTATFINPAGLAFYRSGDFVFTPAFNQLRNNTSFKNTKTSSQRNALGLGLTGFVTASPTENNKGSVAVAIALNRTAWFGNNLSYRGLNNANSYSQKFLEEIAGVGDANLVASKYPFGSSLAFNTYWIDTVAGGTNGNFTYQSRAPFRTGLLQENEITSKGGLSELAIAVAGSRQEKFFYGFTLGIPFLQFERTSSIYECSYYFSMKTESWNAAKCAPYLPRPKKSDHKYRRGVLGCVTGSKQYPGAALLTTSAALSVGIGMVRYFGPEEVKRAVIQNRPEVVIQTGNVDAYLLGSGIPAKRSLLRKITMEIANRADKPKVLDAGALYLTGTSKSPTIITPHVGELAQLLNVSATAIESNPTIYAQTAAEKYKVTVLLKGNKTLVANRNRIIQLP